MNNCNDRSVPSWSSMNTKSIWRTPSATRKLSCGNKKLSTNNDWKNRKKFRLPAKDKSKQSTKSCRLSGRSSKPSLKNSSAPTQMQLSRWKTNEPTQSASTPNWAKNCPNLTSWVRISTSRSTLCPKTLKFRNSWRFQSPWWQACSSFFRSSPAARRTTKSLPQKSSWCRSSSSMSSIKLKCSREPPTLIRFKINPQLTPLRMVARRWAGC